MRETLDGLQGGQIRGRMITNLRYADEIILLATSEAELQGLVDRLDRVSRKYSLLINVDKTKVMASDGIACRILIQNELLEQVDKFQYLGSSSNMEVLAPFALLTLGSLITEDDECTPSAYSSSHGRATLNSLDMASMTITNNSGLNPDPLCIPTFTSKPSC